MEPPTQPTEAHEWRLRAKESWKAAQLLALTSKPPFVYSATSRLYYAVYQGLAAHVLDHRPGMALPKKHGALWNYLLSVDEFNRFGRLLQDLFSWRRKADYLDDDVAESHVRKLLAQCQPSLAEIKVDV